MINYSIDIKPSSLKLSIVTNSVALYCSFRKIYESSLINTDIKSDKVLLITESTQCNAFYFEMVDGKVDNYTTLNEAVLAVCFEVTRLSVRCLENVYICHAAAVSLAGETILIPASSGKGKSTLSSVLVGEGWKLINDDVVPINGEQELIPLNLPLKIKEGALNVIETYYTSISEMPLMVRRDGVKFRFLSISNHKRCSVYKKYRVTKILLPKYDPLNPMLLKQICPSEASDRIRSESEDLWAILNNGDSDYFTSKIDVFSLRYCDANETVSLLGKYIFKKPKCSECVFK